MSPLGVGLIAILLSLAGLHLYWGLGGRWPGHDEESLRLLVAGIRNGPMYGLGPCAMVAAALAAAAAVVYAGHSSIVPAQFTWIVLAGYVVLILVFGMRGLAPYLSPAFEYARGTPFFDLNRLYYAPACLLVAVALAADFPRGSG